MISDNETWIIDAGDSIVRQRAARGESSLTRLDRMVYCLWVADYGMRNAGDFQPTIFAHHFKKRARSCHES